MRNIEESRARKVTPIKTGGRYSYRKHLSVEQEEELSMKNAYMPIETITRLWMT